MSTTDRIEKKVLLKATRQRVWDALTDSRQFGSWFGVRIDGPFRAGKGAKGTIVPTTVDPAAAEQQKPHEGAEFDMIVEAIEAQRVFSFRWHPFAIDRTKDYSAEPTTLVTFTLDEQAGGILLTVTETGFDGIPLDRRAKAFAANDGGWTQQMRLISRYLADAS